ncbi:MAG: hypothetical protein EPO21_18030 [Chloroflexota bacterium]|nr:MAG: hypothetical protein EPO21_18030 [Chloroflexota bacterium]
MTHFFVWQSPPGLRESLLRDIAPSTGTEQEWITLPSRLKEGVAIRSLVDRFVKIARTLSQVRKIVVEYSTQVPQIWTIIEAEPFEWAPREAVYEAQWQALEPYGDIAINFRLENLAEYDDGVIENMLPKNPEVIFER